MSGTETLGASRVESTAMRPGADRTLELLRRQIGRSLDQVETPVAILDLDRLEANLQSLQAYADSHGIALWPHTKTHKSPEIGLRQLAIGARGLTVAKTGEAEVFHEAGAPRILLHYPPLGADKWDRLARFAAEGLELTVAVDSLAPAEGLSAALRQRGMTAELLVELDVGLHRTGQVTVAGAVELAQQLSKLPAVEVAGISCYPGHAREDPDTIGSVVEAVDGLLRETRDTFTAAGIRCDRISGGSTPTRYVTHTTCVNELRAGTYALLDRVDAPAEPALGPEACALSVAVTVVSDTVPGQIVIDAGSKTLTSDSHPDGGHGRIVGWPDARLHTLNEEHGYVDVSGMHERPVLGDRLQVIPNHACGCVNLHDGLLGAREGVVERVLLVAARGLVR
jgi:D-serine deaminase-like pyridoxal phosphate-dependent protein